MKIVFANSAWVSTIERLILARGRFKSVRLNVRYGLVIHPEFGPVLIDTGYTPHALSGAGRSLILRIYAHILRPVLNPDGQPKAVLARLGFTPDDVNVVVVTHFHADHVSGLALFPNARFIVDGPAWAAVSTAAYWQNLRHGVFTELLPEDFAARVQPLNGTDILGDQSLIAVPLPGHAKGHFGVLIDAAPTAILYGVDAQWLRQAAIEDRTPSGPARLIMDDPAAMKHSSGIIAHHIAVGHEVVLCHDPAAYPLDLETDGSTA